MKNTSWRFLIPLILFLAIAYFFIKGLSLDPRTLPSSLRDKPAPAFRLPSLEKPAQFYTNKIFLNHTSLLTVWASWCEACRIDQPFLMSLHKDFPHLQLVGLNYKDEAIHAKQWLNLLGNPYDLVLADIDGQAAINYGVYGTPENYLIDNHGIIRVKHVGPLNQEIWQKEFVPYINKEAL